MDRLRLSTRSKKKTDCHFEELPYSHILFWFSKKETHSEPIYVNSCHMSHLSYEEKLKLHEGHTIKLRDSEGFHDALILRMGSLDAVIEAEKRVDELVEQGFDTDRIRKELDKEVDCDASDSDDEDYVLPESENLLLRATPESSQILKEKEREKKLIADYENPKNQSTPKGQRSFGKPVKNIQAQLEYSKKRESSFSLSGATAQKRPKQQQKDQAKCESSNGVSASHLLLLESRVQTGLMKQLIKLTEDQNQMLRQVFCPQESKNRQDEVIAGYQGQSFKLSDLADNPNVFAREFVLKKHGEEFCANATVEPRGRTPRVAMADSDVQELKDKLDTWFSWYNWKAVRGSVNQMCRDMTTKLREKKDKSDKAMSSTQPHEAA